MEIEYGFMEGTGKTYTKMKKKMPICFVDLGKTELMEKPKKGEELVVEQ